MDASIGIMQVDFMIPVIRFHATDEEIRTFDNPHDAIEHSKQLNASKNNALIETIRGAIVKSIDWCETELVLKLDNNTFFYVKVKNNKASCEVDSKPSSYKRDIRLDEVVLQFDGIGVDDDDEIDVPDQIWSRREIATRIIGSKIKGLWYADTLFWILFENGSLSCSVLLKEHGEPFLYWLEDD